MTRDAVRAERPPADALAALRGAVGAGGIREAWTRTGLATEDATADVAIFAPDAYAAPAVGAATRTPERGPTDGD